MEVTGGKGVSIIFDAVGGDVFNESLKWYAKLIFDSMQNGVFELQYPSPALHTRVKS